MLTVFVIVRASDVSVDVLRCPDCRFVPGMGFAPHRFILCGRH